MTTLPVAETVHTSRRQRELLDAVVTRGSCSVNELAGLLEVSDQTVRRIVRPLVEAGLLHKVHGAIIAPDRFRDPPFQARMAENQKSKEAIAAAVAELVEDGSTVMLDTGSTTAYVARALTRRSNLTVITNSSLIAATLSVVPGNRTFMAGVELRDHDGASFDATAYRVIQRFSANYAILSAAALDGDHGFMVQEHCEAEFSELYAGAADYVLMACDSSKFGRRSLVSSVDLQRIDELITDSTPPGQITEALERNEVAVRLA